MFNLESNTNAEIEAWLAGIPKNRVQAKILYFTENSALYEKDPAEEAVLNKNLQEALYKANYMKPSSAEVKKVYYDFEKNEKTELVEFMTRNFLVSEVMERTGWKLINKRVKVLNYICQGAELKRDDNTITAYFTSEIPVSIGPDEFFGLPGLILVVEINGETAFMATSIDLAFPGKGIISKPDKGKKVTREEFNNIVEEKIKEFEEMEKKEKWGNKIKK
jgi:GLPGLI family protein